MDVTASPAGFWSYAHQDDEADQGRIQRLAKDLANEYSLLTGEEIDIFIDRQSIKWGEQWRARIDTALVNTTFFLPVITPRYFRRLECRKELLTFHAQATSLGMKEYILPIYYANVPDLTEDNPDEAVAIVARTQYFPWTGLRLESPESASYREGLNQLAMRMVNIAEDLASRATVGPSGERSTDEPRTLDLLAQVRERWPELVEVVEKDRENEAMWAALWETHFDRVDRLQRSGRPGARGGLVLKLASDSLPLAQTHVDIAKRYSALAIELDPLLIALFRLARDGAEGISDLLQDLRADISDTCDRIADTAVTNSELNQYAALSREMAAVLRLFDASAEYVIEGNRLLASWYELAFGTPHVGISREQVTPPQKGTT